METSLIFDEQHLTVTYYADVESGRTGFEVFDRSNGCTVAIPDTDTICAGILEQMRVWREETTPGEDEVIAYFQRFLDAFGHRMVVQ
jgi:hypothetical protein